MPRRHIRRDMASLAAVGAVAVVSGALFYYLQYHLTVGLWDSYRQMEARAEEWRQAFIQKKSW